MDYCAVGSIVTLQNINKTDLTEPQIAFILHCTLLALVYLNSQKIIHRDVKGRNILLTADGDVKLADFGVSSTLKDNSSAHLQRSVSSKRKEMANSGDCGPRPPKPPIGFEDEDNDDGGAGIAGSPLWMAPEVCEKHVANYKSDIWSLGITALEIAENRLPYAEMNNALRIMRAITLNPSPTLTAGRWSPEFNSFVNRCLIKDPSKRPDAFEMISHPFLKIHAPLTPKGSSPSTSSALTSPSQLTAPALTPVSSKVVLKPLLDQFFQTKAKRAADEKAYDAHRRPCVVRLHTRPLTYLPVTCVVQWSRGGSATIECDRYGQRYCGRGRERTN